VTNDPTIEKVARLVLENPKGLMLLRDELSGWIGSLDRYGGAGGDRAFYLESYGGRPYAVDRMKDPEPIVVPSLSVVILGGMQPDRMVTLIFSGDDDGLAARFIYVWPERTSPQRPKNPLPTGAKTKLTKLYELEERRDAESGNRNPLRFDDRAASTLQTYRTQVASAETEALSFLAGQAAGDGGQAGYNSGASLLVRRPRGAESAGWHLGNGGHGSDSVPRWICRSHGAPLLW
jgi:hypothetical protein